MGTMERPIRVGCKFFVALIETVDGNKESVRIGGVEHHWDGELAGFLEQRGELVAVVSEEIAAGVVQLKTEIFPQFHTAGSPFDEALQTLDGAGEETGLVQIVPIHPGDGAKAAFGSIPEFPDHTECRFAHLHGDVEDALDSAGIHDRKNCLGILRVKVIMIVNGRYQGRLELVSWRNKHGLWFKRAERQLDFGLGGDHGDKLVLRCEIVTHVRSLPWSSA